MFPHEGSLTKFPLANVPLTKVTLAKVPIVNVPLANIPSQTFSPVALCEHSSQTFSRLWRGLTLPHPSACGMNKDTQYDKAKQTTAKLHHTVEQGLILNHAVLNAR